MRFSHCLSALSFGLLSIAVSSAALAESPRVVMRTGRFPVAALAKGKVATQSALEKAARQLLVEQIPASVKAELGVATMTELTSGARVVKMPQMHRGLPVAHRGVAVTFGADDVAEVVSAALEEDLPGDVSPQITAGEAAVNAGAIAGIDMNPARALLVVWPTPDGAKLVWALDAPVIAPLPYLPVVVVDAASGEVLLKYNAVTTLDQATMFPTNPVKSPKQISVVLPVGVGQTTLQNSLVQSENCIDTHKLKAINFMGFNVNVHVCELLQTAKPDVNGDYLSTTYGGDTDPEDAFSELSMFYHVNRAYSFFRGYQANLQVNGAEAIPTVSNLRLPDGYDTLDIAKLMNPNLPLVPFQNAFFSPADPLFGAIFGFSGGAMFFGQGPNRDYSYDGDVVYHEFTHSVVNVTLKLVGSPHLDEYGVSYSPGAMNEALADYFSSAIAGDPDVGEYASKDFAPNLTAIRSLSNPDACPSAVGGEVHQDATMFSGSLWDVRKTLTPAQQADFDGAVFKAMNSSPTGDLAYEELGKLILTAIDASPLGKPVSAALTAAFTMRGLWPKCTRVIESAGQKLSGPKELQGLFWAPGTQTTMATAQNGGYTPGVVQFHQKLPDGAGKLAVTFTSVTVGGGGLGVGGTPFTPKLLVQFGKDPLQFQYGPLRTSADAVLVDPTASGKAYTGVVAVPKGATEAYVMIGSTGQSDGAYTALTLTAEPAPVEMGTGGGSASSASGAGGSGIKDNPEPREVGGCGCNVPGEDTSGAAAAVTALAMAGLFAARRRRRA